MSGDFHYDFIMGKEVVRAAINDGMTLSGYLEKLDPTYAYPEHQRSMDAFQRQLMKYGIRTQSVPEAGIYADTVSRFWDDDELGTAEQRSALFMEWMAREYRRYTPQTAGGKFVTPTAAGALRFPAGDTAPNYTLFPPAVRDMLTYQEIAPSILPWLVAHTRPVTGQAYKALYLTDDATAQTSAKMARVGKLAEVPAVSFATSEHDIKIRKYGRRLVAAYEDLRWMSLDMLSWAIRYIAAVADADKGATAIDVLINGDGSNPASNINGSTYDTGNVLSLKMWLRYVLSYKRPYTLNTVIGTDAAVVDLLVLPAGSANTGLTSWTQQNLPGAVKLAMPNRPQSEIVAINEATAPASKLLAFDRNWTLEMVSEIGGDIVETNRVIERQFEQVVMTESVGFAIIAPGQNKILSYTA